MAQYEILSCKPFLQAFPLTFTAHRNKERSKNATELMRLVIFLANELQREKAKT